MGLRLPVLTSCLLVVELKLSSRVARVAQEGRALAISRSAREFMAFDKGRLVRLVGLVVVFMASHPVDA